MPFLSALGPVLDYDDAQHLRRHATTSRWDESRAHVAGMGGALSVTGVMDCGVSPRRLIDAVHDSFVARGGVVLTGTEATRVDVYDDAAVVECRRWRDPDGRHRDDDTARLPPPPSVRCRAVLDCTGHFSRFAAHARERRGQRTPWSVAPGRVSPRGHVVVVGGCLEAPAWPLGNDTADLLACLGPSDDPRFGQALWEAFPADLALAPDRRTVYMFSYVDDHPDRPSLAEYAGRFLEGVASYQGLAAPPRAVRFLAGALPCYTDAEGPHVLSEINRVAHVGDASAAHSPLSFGGFGALVRGLPPLRRRLGATLRAGRVDAKSLRAGGGYLPELSAGWLFNRSMALPVERRGQLPDARVLKVLRLTFSSLRLLQAAGFEAPARRFLADELRPVPLIALLLLMGARNPAVAYAAAARAGAATFARWYAHFLCMCAASAWRACASALARAWHAAAQPRRRSHASAPVECGSPTPAGAHLLF